METTSQSRWQKPPIFASKGKGNGNGPEQPDNLPGGAGEGTDRKLKKKLWTPQRIAIATGVILFLAFVAYGFSTTTGGSRLNVERERITVSQVQQQPFQEQINVTGNVVPRTIVYLDALEGGRIEEVFIREGAIVNEGDPILRLSNISVQRDLLDSQASLAEQENQLESQRIQTARENLRVRQDLMQLDYNINNLQRQFDELQQLVNNGVYSASYDEYERVRDDLAYQIQRRELTQQQFRQDSLEAALGLERMGATVERMRQNLNIVMQSLEYLTLRAPVSGHLTSLDAELGQIRSTGFRFGQIDVLDSGYKIRAGIDEFYLSRVQTGQTARTTAIAGQEYQLQITRVYPEVTNGQFEVDFEFVGEIPADIRRGQTIRFYLELSDPAEAVTLARGGFYQTTGGNYVYVVDPSGDFAVKRNIRIGRQNPNVYEVLEGLEPGDQVITSSYETFGDADRLILN
jgi:HlyD family secretion protein